MGFLGGSVIKNPPANGGDARDTRSSLGSGRSPGGGKGNPLQYYYLGNAMDREAWEQSIGLQSQTRLSTHINIRRKYIVGNCCSYGTNSDAQNVASFIFPYLTYFYLVPPFLPNGW